MSRPRPRFTEPPRGLTGQECAWYLGLGTTQFDTVRDALRDAGFPAADPITGRYDRRAVDRWLDQRAGLVDTPANDDIMAGLRQWARGGQQ